MFLNSPDQIPTTIERVHFVIFEFPKNLSFPNLPTAIINILPNDKNNITIEDIHQIEEFVRTKQSTNFIVAVYHADRMTQQAQNCFLKLLEEPGDRIHFSFFTHHANQLLPTVRSRAHNFTIKSNPKINSPPECDAKLINLAKQYISATPRQLAPLSQTLSKDRTEALQMLDVAIELLYKSYFKTGNPKFLDKLTNLLKAHDNIKNNGHIRLQLVAAMI
jgi:hypothetical protein